MQLKKINLKKIFHPLFLILPIFLMSEEFLQQSVTSIIPDYIEVCQNAATNKRYFRKFRSFPEYSSVVECNYAQNEFDSYLFTNGSSQMFDNLEIFRKLDTIGNPYIVKNENMGLFSGTTLRYIIVADQILSFFNLPNHPKIGEIGAGFGGECFILSTCIPFSNYYIFDLPEVTPLIDKVLKTLSVDNVETMNPFSELPDEKIDLLISNYAFSECDLTTQLDYFHRVLKKADRGYILFNDTIDQFETLSLEAFVQLLEDEGMNPKVLPEPVSTHPKNVLIIWDRT